MGKLLGGSQTTTQEIPKWLEDAARVNLARADEISALGYTPYYGPDVAAFTPMQQSAFANTGQAAGAFGLSGGGMTGMEGMPQPTQYAGGVSGYSSAPLFQQSLDALAANRPGQYDYMTGMFIDPVTGAAPRGPFGNAGLTNPEATGVLPTSALDAGFLGGEMGDSPAAGVNGSIGGIGAAGNLSVDIGDGLGGLLGFDPFGGGFE